MCCGELVHTKCNTIRYDRDDCGRIVPVLSGEYLTLRRVTGFQNSDAQIVVVPVVLVFNHLPCVEYPHRCQPQQSAYSRPLPIASREEEERERERTAASAARHCRRDHHHHHHRHHHHPASPTHSNASSLSLASSSPSSESQAPSGGEPSKRSGLLRSARDSFIGRRATPRFTTASVEGSDPGAGTGGSSGGTPATVTSPLLAKAKEKCKLFSRSSSSNSMQRQQYQHCHSQSIEMDVYDTEEPLLFKPDLQ
ncbi:hypothetical protein ZHAS_00008389 [Anopheles sinensis]|uniref:Uncharacterized protein n=1 Tax=Anopheles sinensis TaxID=74873 RepID=A0A084VSB9_ANOSI|nr:hypothetical protein ZHAS_00008389 [Anopheles sinensis]